MPISLLMKEPMKECPECVATVFWHMMFNTYGDRWLARWLHENNSPECHASASGESCFEGESQVNPG
jgi:hypothetical protein